MVSEIIRISPSRYVAVDIRRRVFGAVSMAVVPLACCAVAGMAMSDYRFLLVGLMLLFVAYPGIMAVAWLSMAAAPDVAMKIRPQAWSFGESSAVVTFYSYDEEPSPVDRSEICFDDLKKFEIRGDFAYFFTRIPTFGSKGEYYILPASLLPAGLANHLTDLLYDKQ